MMEIGPRGTGKQSLDEIAAHAAALIGELSANFARLPDVDPQLVKSVIDVVYSVCSSKERPGVDSAKVLTMAADVTGACLASTSTDSHDFLTALRGGTWIAYLALAADEEPSAVERYRTFAVSAIGRMTRIRDDLLDAKSAP